SYGLTTMEAMAAGLPVVALASHGTRATLSAGGGVLVESPEGLWPSIRDLLQRPDRRRGLSEQARERAASETFERTAERLYALLAE
ncbi:MAG: glycosyltransferase, partial [Candidatus Eremiobacterota bacterium]